MLLPGEVARARDDRRVKEQIGYPSLDRLISLVRRHSEFVIFASP
jgi:hypothetical protein